MLVLHYLRKLTSRSSVYSHLRAFSCSKQNMKEQKAYGSWHSDITSSDLTSSSRGLTQLEFDHVTGNMFWLESRHDENGRGVVCSASIHDGNKICDWTPAEYSVRSKVHEYGGGAYFVGHGIVGFTNQSDQRVYIQKEPMAVPQPLTPENPQCRFADGLVGDDCLYIVREDHGRGGTYAANELVRIDMKTKDITLLAHGADFYAYPCLDVSMSTIYWMQWNNPNMPWDATEIWSAKLDDLGHVIHSSSKKLLGDGHTNYQQPLISPTGVLHVISDETDFWNVYSVEQNNDCVTLKNVWEVNCDIGQPLWQFKQSSYRFCHADAALSVFISTKGTYLKNDKLNSIQPIETSISDYSQSGGIQFANSSTLLIMGASPTEIASVKIMNLENNQITVVRRSKDMQVDAESISIGEEIKYKTTNDQFAYAYYYPPKNTKYECLPGELPPLLVMAHGGPTGATSNAFDMKKQYWTGKGFAVLDVNFRGSTCHGRKYRDLLKTQWGIMDVDDCCYGARHICSMGKADPKRLCISGGSSGGYLVLRAISVPNTFAVAVSRYGVSDLELLQKDTHKFEAYYNIQLIGPYPEAVSIFHDRSPIYHLDEIVCPVGFFQGLDDKVVPPNQAEAMYRAVKDKKLPTFLVMFAGEGHGFRNAENIRLALDGEYFYFCSVLGIQPTLQIADNLMHIDNMHGQATNKL